VNGLAVVMARAQVGSFRDAATGALLRVTDPVGAATYGIAGLTMLLIRYVFPKIKNKALKKVPPTLGAVALASMVAKALQLPVRTLADVAGAETFRGGLSVLPKLGWPTAGIPPAHLLSVVLPYAVTMAAVGCIESLLTMQLVDGIVDDGTRGSTRRECIGQGLGNIASALTGGIGGCALLGQSLINVESGGGASRISGMSMAVFLGLGIVCFAPLLGQVPVAALVGVMLLVCQSTFSWSSLRIMGKIPRLDAAVIMLVSVVTVVEDLAVAVLVGTVASALGFAWKQSTSITASHSDDAGSKTYAMNGPLFFGSATKFAEIFAPKTDPPEVTVDFAGTRILDHSGLEAVNTLADRYGAAGKTLRLRGLSSDCAGLLSRLHEGGLPPYEVIESDPSKDPVYEVAEDSKYYKDVPVPKPVS